MRDSDREYVLSGIGRICQSLISEAEALCELIDSEDDFESVARRVSSFENEADEVKHDITYFYRENKLYTDVEAMMIMDILSAVEICTDIADDIAGLIIRLNISEIKDNCVSGFVSAGTGAVKMNELISTIRRRSKADTPVRDIIDLDHFSVEYDKIYDINMRKLYRDGTDPLEIMRWTQVYDAFKKLFDSYEYVAECCGKYCIILA